MSQGLGTPLFKRWSQSVQLRWRNTSIHQSLQDFNTKQASSVTQCFSLVVFYFISLFEFLDNGSSIKLCRVNNVQRPILRVFPWFHIYLFFGDGRRLEPLFTF
eukprot:Lithocolla_globosa_v1_NODE_4344_length_1457_cov_11.495007.p3 type:complete len:103 gc:universal NODE_4344_length_1457_cov_11.495007:423-115(-)